MKSPPLPAILLFVNIGNVTAFLVDWAHHREITDFNLYVFLIITVLILGMLYAYQAGRKDSES